jgi:hypothetical protein
LHLLAALLLCRCANPDTQTPTATLSIEPCFYADEQEDPAPAPQPGEPTPPPQSGNLSASVTIPDEGPPAVPEPVAIVPSAGQGGAATEGAEEGTGNRTRRPGQGFFQISPQGQRIVYVIDRSSSMGEHGALEAACRELLASLEHLPATAQFQVVLYNRTASPLLLDGRADLVAAGPESVRQVEDALATLRPAGSTNHVEAIKTALTLLPDVLFLVTDAGDLTRQQVRYVTVRNQGRAVIHAIELSDRSEQGDGPLALLARSNGGTYRVVNPEAAGR